MKLNCKVKRGFDDIGSYARQPSMNWVVEFEDGEQVEVANFGKGAIALGLCYQKNESHQWYGRAAETAVDEFMGW